jgi:hypothetical protein
MLKSKLGYVEKVKLALYLDLGLVYKLMMPGAILLGVFAPVFFEEMHLRLAVGFVGAVIMLLIGLPVACMGRLRKMDEDYGEGVADAFIAWKRTASKDAYLDLEAIARKVREAREETPE